MSYNPKPWHVLAAAVALVGAEKLGACGSGPETEPVSLPASPAVNLVYEYQPGDGPQDAVTGCTDTPEEWNLVWADMKQEIRYVDRDLEPLARDTHDFSDTQRRLGDLVTISCNEDPNYTG